MQDIECRFARRVVVAQQSRQRTERALLVKMDKQVLLPRYLLERARLIRLAAGRDAA
jgi:hypothetical protein